ncbi:hypothetical protein [Streptomyces mordarskii]|uniref:Uncharacterized protein n=1 Tax=Streptomyces mordarskii TaxID=1226758 RepID=A0ABN1BX99_9ACTN
MVIASRKADQCRAAAEAINASGARGHCTAIPADLSSPEGPCEALRDHGADPAGTAGHHGRPAVHGEQIGVVGS